MNGPRNQFGPDDPFAIRDRFGPTMLGNCTIERFLDQSQSERAIWRKVYARGLQAFNARETELLLKVSNDNIPYVVKFHEIMRKGSPLANPRKTNSSIAVTTLDAGLDLDQWMSIAPIHPNSHLMLEHPFQHPQTFLALARQLLITLQEFHEKGYVHLDLHRKNICVSYVPYPFDRNQPLALNLDAMRLIDLGYSINPRKLPLGELVIPLYPSEYMAPSLRDALRLNPDVQEGGSSLGLLLDRPSQSSAEYNDARRACIVALENLDWRADLYSVGFMLNNLVDDAIRHADQVDRRLELIDSLPGRLMQFDRERVDRDSMSVPPMPHAALIEELGKAIDGDEVKRILTFNVGPIALRGTESAAIEIMPVVKTASAWPNRILIPAIIAALLLFSVIVTLMYYDDLRQLVQASPVAVPVLTAKRGDCANCPPVVAIDNGVLLATRQATYAEFAACVAAGQCAARPMRTAGASANEPARNVSAYDGEQLANWLSNTSGRKWRLATLEALEAARANREPARWGNVGAVAGEITGDCALDSPRSADGSCVFRVALAGPAFEDGAGETSRHWLLATGRSQAYGVRLMEDPRR